MDVQIALKYLISICSLYWLLYSAMRLIIAIDKTTVAQFYNRAGCLRTSLTPNFRAMCKGNGFMPGPQGTTRQISVFLNKINRLIAKIYCLNKRYGIHILSLVGALQYVFLIPFLF